MIGQIGSMVQQDGNAGVDAAMGNFMQSMDVARQSSELKSDLQQLLSNNACGGVPLKRLEKNLIAFARGTPPLKMASIPVSPGPFRDSDYQTLLDDLVSDQFKGWMFNHFISDSIANVSVRRDAEGRPSSISGQYAYEGIALGN